MAMFESTPTPPSNLPMQPGPAFPPPPPPPPPPSFGPPPAPRPTYDPGPAAEPASQAKVYTMPEKFRSASGGGSGGGRRGSKRLVIILIVVLVVAGLGVAALFAFQNVFNQPANENVNLVINRNQNQNLNLNQNANLNTNAAANANENTNATSNANTNATNTNTANSNANGNTNANANTNTSIRTTPLPSSADGDADGLTDVEEVVYGTDVSKPDTDGDGFIDGKKAQTDGTILGELYLGYNPKGTGQLEDSTLVKRQANSLNSLSALIPSSWTAVLDQAGGILINPSQATGEFFQVRINNNDTRQSPTEWYKTVSPTADVNSLQTDAFNGFEVVWSEDQSTAYLFKDTKVYSIQYATGTLTQVNYWTTFDMLVRSFKLVATSS